MITGLLPSLCVIVILPLVKTNEKKVFISIIILIAITAACAIWNYILINSLDSGVNNFVTEYSSVLFTLIPASYAFILPFVPGIIGENGFESSNKTLLKSPYLFLKGKHRTLIRSGGPLLSVLVIILMVMGMAESYDSWHSYDIQEYYPDDPHHSYAIEVLSRDIPSLMNSTSYHSGNILDPNFVTMDVISDLKNWVEDAEKGNDWGHYHMSVNVEVLVDSEILVNKSEDLLDGRIVTEIMIDNGNMKWNYRLSDYSTDHMIISHIGLNNTYNETGYWGEWKDKNLTITLENLTIVKAILHYGEGTGHLAAYGGNTEQFIGLRGDRIVFIYSSRSNWIS